MTINHKIKEIDPIQVIGAAGVALTPKGSRWVGLCPFHSDSKPSFYLFDDGYYHCFGCLAHGDVITFVMNFYNLSFPEALNFLGIAGNEKNKIDDKALVLELKKKKAERQARLQRERDLVETLSLLIRATNKASRDFTIQDFDKYGQILEPLAWWKYCHETLARGDKEEKNRVIEALKDMDTISRNYLFQPDFDYRGWLRELNGETYGRKKIKIQIE